MSNPVEKTPAQKKIKLGGLFLDFFDADFKILEKWITGSIFLILEKMFLSCCRFLGCIPGIFFLPLTFDFWGLGDTPTNAQLSSWV